MTKPTESSEPNELEQRLGAGLKRWAQAGEPTLDLEAYVRAQAALPRRRPAWLRWVGTAAAAAAIVVGLGGTFPTWAGAASGWPLVGPVVTEIIMKDAGLKWAYDNDLLQGAVAEAKDGEMTVRVLGVMADPVRTTVIYQITGVAEPPADTDRPVRSSGVDLVGRFSHPVLNWPKISLLGVPGQDGYYLAQHAPLWTPLGLVGTFSTSPLGVDAGPLMFHVDFQDHRVLLDVPVSRAAADRYSKTVPVGQSQTFADVTITVDALVQTPVETLVQYRVEKPAFTGGGYGWSDNKYSAYIEGADGTREYGRDTFNGHSRMMQAFPAVDGPSKLVFPLEVKGAPAEMRWPLQKGAVAEAKGVPVTLADWTVSGDTLYLEWEYEATPALMAFAPVEVLDADGNTHAVVEKQATWSEVKGMTSKAVQLQMPEGVTPVAVRSSTVAVGVVGPWVFDLPAR